MVIMVLEISDFLNRVEATQYTIFTQKLHASVSKTLETYNGKIIRTDNNHYVVTFESVTDAIPCTYKIQYRFKYVTPKHQSFSRRLNIALSATPQYNEPQVAFTKNLCEIIKDQVVMTSTVKSLYQRANEHAEIDTERVRVLTVKEEEFFSQIIEVLEQYWAQSSLTVTTFSSALGLTYAQLYRRLLGLTGKAPNQFIKDYRLHKALIMLHDRQGSIAEIAKQTGFNSSSYFSDCFL
ncbi:MAG: helix-turn-helix transcriptional regulator, partial [Winogradskyella sp.]|nr:helix-turn-helix transcriptional regulator [Winogradskyella sp.]